MILALIPARFASARLPGKPLIKIDGLPLIIHILKRVKMSKKIEKVVVCADDLRIKKIVQKYGGDCQLTSKLHKNGTERIAEIARKYKKKLKLIVDIQCDELFLKPKYIDKLINFHLKKKKFDIVVPHSPISTAEAKDINTVKLISNFENKIVYMTRSLAPSFFRNKNKSKFCRHLDFISFKPKALFKYVNLKKSKNEISESVELNRALDNDFNLGTLEIKTNDFSINTNSQLIMARKLIKRCQIRRKY